MAGQLLTLVRLLLFVFAVVFGILLIRTFSLRNPETDLSPCRADDVDFIRLDNGTIERFCSALRMKTISYDEGDYNRQELERLVQFIISSYPELHSSSHVTWEKVGNYSLLYHVKGSKPALKPYLLMAHLDVVPANENDWDSPPFAADIRDGYIYARGAMDDKGPLFEILEAVEFYLKQRQPQRSFYIAFGHDEEVTGQDGARIIAQKLMESGVQFEYILDEGLAVTRGLLSFIHKPIAIIGVTEKGYLNVKLSVKVEGGHSSMPPHESSIGILANAVVKLETNPQPSMLGTGPETGMLEHLAPEASFPIRVILSNLWLFRPFVSRFMSLSPLTNSIIRTTTAVTMFNAGVKKNVLAPYAEAIVNHRIHPSQTVSEVLEHDKKFINDERVKMETENAMEAAPVSDYGPHCFGYQKIRSTIMQIWEKDKAIVIPGLMIANTDTKHYWKLSKNIYRFAPTVLEKDDFKRYHGINERISIENLELAINFYYHLMVNSDSESLKLSDHEKKHHDF